LKDFDKWIDNWEQGINLAQKKVAATLSPSDWFNDLMNTLAGILPNWSESYAIHKGDEVENETITFRVVANDLRKVVDRKQKGTTKIAKGSFGPTFAEVEHTEEGPKNYPGPANSRLQIAQDLKIVQDLQIVPQISVCMQRGNIMVFIQHKDAFIYFVTLDPEVGNLPSKFRD